MRGCGASCDGDAEIRRCAAVSGENKGADGSSGGKRTGREDTDGGECSGSVSGGRGKHRGKYFGTGKHRNGTGNENESGSAAVSEEQNLSGTDPAGSGEQSTSGGEQTGAAENNTGTAQTDPAPGAEPSSAPVTASGSETAETAAQVWQEYTVQKGDSLSKISERYYGTMSRVKDICELNQIAVEDLIYAGQKIYLPK